MNLPLTIPVIKGEELKTEIAELGPQNKMLVVLVLAVRDLKRCFESEPLITTFFVEDLAD